MLAVVVLLGALVVGGQFGSRPLLTLALPAVALLVAIPVLGPTPRD